MQNNNEKDNDGYTGKGFSTFIAKVLATTDPGVIYQHNWHIDLIADKLEKLYRGTVKRLIINMPPRSLKSVSVSVAWPAWLLAQDPSIRIMAASYSSILSLKHSQDTRLVLESPWYKQEFPRTVICKGENEKSKFVTTERGFRFATSVGGTATGEGADVLIVDDPHSPLQAASQLQRQQAISWFDQTFSTRLNSKKSGTIVVVMQRLHVDDLSGHLLKTGDWEHLCLPAVIDENTVFNYLSENKLLMTGNQLHAAREGAAEVALAKRQLGSAGFNAQYQQHPLSAKGGMVETGWIKRYEESGNGCWVTGDGKRSLTQSWDTAVKCGTGNDYSVCTTWAEDNNNYYLIDVYAGKLEYPALKRMCVFLAEKWQPHGVLIEDKASGQALLQDLRQSTKIPVIAISPHIDKVSRFAHVTTFFEAGRVYLPSSAPWLAAYEAELLSFPHGNHDDMVDSTSQFLNWARAKKGAGPRMRRL